MTDAHRAISRESRADIEHLAGNIGERNVFRPTQYRQAEEWLGLQLQRAGLRMSRQAYACEGVDCVNIAGELPGASRPDEIVVIGAHYDAVKGCPAANDNGSGVAAVLALARRFASRTAPARTVRFGLFANEEPPFFWTDEMGSLVYARACKDRHENIVGMITPETIGCYSDREDSQDYPIPVHSVYPTVGDFIAFLGMYEARDLLRACVSTFRQCAQFPSIGAGLPAIVPMVGASDHWSFWKCGYPALMVTDTAPFRYAHYHKPTDTPDKIDYDRMARVIDGLDHVVTALVNPDH